MSENGRSPVDPPDIMLYSPVKKRLLLIHILNQKRAGGIEPPSLAWKAKVLPLNYARIF